jgi:hypothetical protein
LILNTLDLVCSKPLTLILPVVICKMIRTYIPQRMPHVSIAIANLSAATWPPYLISKEYAPGTGRFTYALLLNPITTD